MTKHQASPDVQLRAFGAIKVLCAGSHTNIQEAEKIGMRARILTAMAMYGANEDVKQRGTGALGVLDGGAGSADGAKITIGEGTPIVEE